jgi:pyruvate/2-oxoglutarate dehydrogenase complex dihydrolipoamide dehydrogenase (E3) component
MRSYGQRQRTFGPWVSVRQPAFSHAAYDDFRVVRDNLSGGNRTTRGRVIPFCLFTDPELARIGMNETEAGPQRSISEW